MVQSCGQLRGAVGACGDEIGTLSDSAIGAIADWTGIQMEVDVEIRPGGGCVHSCRIDTCILSS